MNIIVRLKERVLCLLAVAALTLPAEGAPPPQRHTEVSIRGQAFFINGQPTYAGRSYQGMKVEGLLMNARLVQATFDDLNPATRARWAYPDGPWDPERNTREFLAAMPGWRERGLLAFTLNLQGGSPEGYSQVQPWHNSAFTADGGLRPEFMARLERVLNRADELGMAVILGLFYFGQDERLADEAAVVRGVDNAVDWVLERGYRHVLIEVNNECNVRYDHAVLRPDRVHELIERVQSRQRDGRRLLVSTSYGGGTLPQEQVVRRADFLLLHGNGVQEPARIRDMVDRCRALPAYRGQPILFNEDDHFEFDRPDNNMLAAVSRYASWGYFDFRKKGEGFDEGYQSVPVNWGLSSARKRGFFDLLTRLTAGAPTAAKPLKVFILVGQSNMEGHAQVGTFDYLGDDPATAPLLRQMRDEHGQPRVCEEVWISYLTGAEENRIERTGRLTAGYGSLWGVDPTKPGEKIGPEFTFGLALEAALDEPVVIIKTAWGGKSLHTDFRPPSAGPYVLNEFQRKLYYGPKGHGVPEDMTQWLASKEQETGRCYRLMIGHVRKVLGDLRRVCPAYQEGQGYELSGFVWFQGWNDLVDGHTYPDRGQPGRFDEYGDLLAHLIRDVRKDLDAPSMPFVIGVLGVDGAKAGPDIIAFRDAMTAPALRPEFRGNVAAVPTAPFWSEELGAIAAKHDRVRQFRYYLDAKHKDHANADGHMTEQEKQEQVRLFEASLISPAEAALWKRGASNAGYHYLGCAKTFALMGRAFAEANLGMMRGAPRP